MNKLLKYLSLLLVSTMLFVACDDDSTSPDDNGDEFFYLSSDVDFKTYNQYDLATDGSKMEETEHTDSLTYQGKVEKSGRESFEYQNYTNEGNDPENFEEAEKRNYAQESNKFYVHSEFLLNSLSDIDLLGLDISQILDLNNQWLLVGDVETTGRWTLFENDDVVIEFQDFQINANVKMTSELDGSETVQIGGKTFQADKYLVNVNIQTDEGEQFEASIDVKTRFWLVENLGIYKIRREPVVETILLQELEIKGNESILINYDRGPFGTN